ncbi:MAG TPA: protein-methionine-sulfoxide reductase catalytic subunit MsrP [Alphaproteobacteria bacterium]|nr:protein-methionine-sulfoxide reductase catalytic subunit MsrP [Alphaproteobacteria bacterium]
MLIKIKRGWELPDSAATPEAIYQNRRTLMKSMAVGGLALAGSIAGGVPAFAETESSDPSAGLYPVKRNPKYTLDRDITAEKWSTHYNNFYEFGMDKSIWRAAQQLRIRPWEVEISGMVEKPIKIGIDDLLKKMPLEERLYRHRCVETWAMAVPWSGFPMKALVDMAKPTSGAKYVKMVTFKDSGMAPGQKQFWYPWPYVEGLTIQEATNELAFMVTGMYGHPVPKQDGAPLRLAVPWKYGFKSVKSIVKFEFTDKQPVNFWQDLQSNEYGFWANVNPKVPHPRWSQATEELLGTHKRVPTQLYNGYADQVAYLYKDMKQDRHLFM